MLAGRPLLDLGTGDGQTLSALASGGLAVGIDRSPRALRAARQAGHRALVGADASAIPFRDATFEVVLAADLLHHQDDAHVEATLREAARVLRSNGRVTGWWYTEAAHPAPDAPAHPRSFDQVARIARAVELVDVRPLDLEIVLPGGPQTVGLTAVRR